MYQYFFALVFVFCLVSGVLSLVFILDSVECDRFKMANHRGKNIFLCLCVPVIIMFALFSSIFVALTFNCMLPVFILHSDFIQVAFSCKQRIIRWDVSRYFHIIFLQMFHCASRLICNTISYPILLAHFYTRELSCVLFLFHSWFVVLTLFRRAILFWSYDYYCSFGCWWRNSSSSPCLLIA